MRTSSNRRIDKRYHYAYHAWKILTESILQRGKRYITYSDLSKRLNYGNPLGISELVLDPIAAYCEANDLPQIAVLGVSDDDHMPGDGFVRKWLKDQSFEKLNTRVRNYQEWSLNGPMNSGDLKIAHARYPNGVSIS